jgi:hypothetical protein
LQRSSTDISLVQQLLPGVSRKRVFAHPHRVHFHKSIEEWTEYGRKIGRRAANLYLRPVH